MQTSVPDEPSGANVESSEANVEPLRESDAREQKQQVSKVQQDTPVLVRMNLLVIFNLRGVFFSRRRRFRPN